MKINNSDDNFQLENQSNSPKDKLMSHLGDSHYDKNNNDNNDNSNSDPITIVF